ncbi:anti-sigma factor [Demequina sp. TTPB684]|uniref:anti-sigma factor n=1 Tax=unclassified Demequina TaxID=2620311 RepID=UPI001CF33595|nr:MULTISPECIES: anti-sigma factor [unclassified Demequina]MCB2413011.1 anti-sigma factor [Demequina sp. TTPB684]UPU87080.1 anti-sigma factor [Demequina sp. TMPB413]
MSHLDDDRIAAAALGDPLDEGDTLHLASCAACSARVHELRDIAARAAAAGRPAPLQTPPTRVWDAIQAQVAGDEQEVPDVALVIGADPDADVLEFSPRASKRARFTGRALAAVAAAGVVVGGVGVGVAVWAQGGGVAADVVAEAPLTNLQTEAAAGSARVEARSDGTQVLVISTDYVAAPDADLEVWLIDPEIEGMVSLGFLVSDNGEFAIPEGYDPADYPIVDISLEPRDGVPTHHGDSVTRGVLEL